MLKRNTIEKKYRLNKDKIQISFPEAYNFLNQLERLLERGYHIGTNSNLHLYYKSSFLFYFYFDKNSSSMVNISSKYNRKIKNGTTNNSNYFFDLILPKLLIFKEDKQQTLEIAENEVTTITIHKSKNSARFFKILLECLIELPKDWNSLETTNEIGMLANDLQLYTEFNNLSNKNILEGLQKAVIATIYERNKEARQECLKHWKYNCVVCGFNFEKTYGDLGKDYIHVHHIKPLSTIRKEYRVNPIDDLRPVCPNCHAMIHRNKEALSIEELKSKLRF